MRKRILLLTAMCCLQLGVFPAAASDQEYGPGYGRWTQDEAGWKFLDTDGSYATSGWQISKGNWYYFNEQGYMKTGLVLDNDKYYFLDDEGAMVRNMSLEIGGLTYTFGDDGAAAAGTLIINSQYKAPVVIPPESEKTEIMKANDAMADEILARIITEGMTDSQKAVAIYDWVRGNLSYSATGTIGDWPQAAYEGLRRKRGHCYTYYATSLALLSRAGIPSIEVIRSKDNDHWWNLVYIDGSWYHFDTTPRRQGGRFCLLTTGQLMAYSGSHGNSHIFDQSQYPPTP